MGDLHIWTVKVQMTDGQEFVKEFGTSNAAMEFIEDIGQPKKGVCVFEMSTKSPYKPCLYINPKQITSIRMERII